MDAAGLNLEGEEGNVEEGVELCQPEAVLHARVQDVHGATPAQSEPQNGLPPGSCPLKALMGPRPRTTSRGGDEREETQRNNRVVRKGTQIQVSVHSRFFFAQATGSGATARGLQ